MVSGSDGSQQSLSRADFKQMLLESVNEGSPSFALTSTDSGWQLRGFKPVLLKTLDKHADTGLIVESISLEKMIAFRTTTVLQLMDRLMELLGGTVGATVLDQMGIDVGRSMWVHLEDEVKSDNDLVSMMDIVLAERGWGRCRKLEKVEKEGLTYSIRTEGNPISGKFGINEPMCHFIRGIYRGFLEAYLHKKTKHSEQVSCVAIGASCCTFKITLE